MTEDRISKGERDELRRIVRGDFKALGHELDQRERELGAEIEQRVAQRFEPSDEAGRALARTISAIIADANEAIRVAVHAALQSTDGYRARWRPLDVPLVEWVPEKRDELRRALRADVGARVGAAKLRLERQEVDLLKRLSSDALESDAARAFLAGIPTVAELVPTDRLAELEESFRMDPADETRRLLRQARRDGTIEEASTEPEDDGEPDGEGP